MRSGGKQYRVEPGSVIDVERLAASEGETVELDVLLLNDNGRVAAGEAATSGAKVIAQVVGHGRGPKVTVFKYKAKTRYRRKTGHRQHYTRLEIKDILTGAKTAEDKATRPRPRKPKANPPAGAER